MAKMIDVEVLKEALKDVIPVDEAGTKALETIMEKSVDYDEEAVNARITEAETKAKAEAQAEYAQKLHDTFFAPAKAEGSEGADQQIKDEPEKVEPVDIFDIVE